MEILIFTSYILLLSSYKCIWYWPWQSPIETRSELKCFIKYHHILAVPLYYNHCEHVYMYVKPFGKMLHVTCLIFSNYSLIRLLSLNELFSGIVLVLFVFVGIPYSNLLNKIYISCCAYVPLFINTVLNVVLEIVKCVQDI